MNYDKILTDLGYSESYVAGKGFPNTIEGIKDFGEAVKKKAERNKQFEIDLLNRKIRQIQRHAQINKDKTLFDMVKWDSLGADLKKLKEELNEADP